MGEDTKHINRGALANTYRLDLRTINFDEGYIPLSLDLILNLLLIKSEI
jgi:hypothetical protein